MARKRMSDLESVKFSLNISGENKEVLDRLTAKKEIKYGPFINLLIEKICRMPNEIRVEFTSMCKAQISKLADELAAKPDKYSVRKITKKIEYYTDFLELISSESEEKVKEDFDLVDYEIKEGTLRIPSNWILVNPEDAGKCLYASVLVDRNVEKNKTPYFVFLNNYKYGKDYSKKFENDFYGKCIDVCPDFADTVERERQNKLIEDPEAPGHYLNLEEYLKGPILGMFAILEDDDPYNDDPPYGAVIVRK